MPSRFGLVLVVACAAQLAGCGPGVSPTAGPVPAVTPAPESDFPATLHGYRFTESESISVEQGGGRLYRYRDGSGSGAYVTVFVYPIPDDVRTIADTSRWVLIEADKFIQFMPIQVERGRYDAYETAFSQAEPVVAERDTIPGFAAAVVTRTRGEVAIQLQYLYLLRGEFLKVRITLPQKEWQRSPAPAFARALAQLVYLKGKP